MLRQILLRLNRLKISATIWKWLFLFLIVGILVRLLCIIFHPFTPQPPEPEYQGKKLTEWAREIDQADFFRLPAYQQHQAKNEQAIAAVRHIGTNALPMVLKLCSAKDSWLKKVVEGQIEQWIKEHNSDVEEYNEERSKDQWRSEIKVTFRWADEKHYEGANIIWALGSMTKPIVPDLIQLLQNPNNEIAKNMMGALPGAGTNAILPLIKLLDNPDKNNRLRTAIVLGDFFRLKTPLDVSSNALIVTGSDVFRSQAGVAVPILLQYLDGNDRNSIRRIQAIYALGLIQEDATIVVPDIIHHVQSEPDEMMLENYIRMLGDFGTNARPAVPILVHILETNPRHSDFHPGEDALVSLWKIDPEAAKSFLKKRKADLINAPAKTE